MTAEFVLADHVLHVLDLETPTGRQIHVFHPAGCPNGRCPFNYEINANGYEMFVDLKPGLHRVVYWSHGPSWAGAIPQDADCGYELVAHDDVGDGDDPVPWTEPEDPDRVTIAVSGAMAERVLDGLLFLRNLHDSADVPEPAGTEPIRDRLKQ